MHFHLNSYHKLLGDDSCALVRGCFDSKAASGLGLRSEFNLAFPALVVISYDIVRQCFANIPMIVQPWRPLTFVACPAFCEFGKEPARRVSSSLLRHVAYRFPGGNNKMYPDMSGSVVELI